MEKGPQRLATLGPRDRFLQPLNASATDMKSVSHSSPGASSALTSRVVNLTTASAAEARPAKPGRALGIYARTASTNEPKAPEYDALAARANRWSLKAVVNGLLPTSRTSKCCKWRIPAQQLGVVKGKQSGKATYTGLEVCSSVWACPLCAAKISERRRVELVRAMGEAKRQTLKVFLLTLTIPHGLGDPLPATMEKLQKAMRYFGSGRAAATWRESIGLVGTIRALEVTFGKNGWHPHFHVLVFIDGKVPRAQMEVDASVLWRKAAIKAGLPAPHPVHGCDMSDGSWANRYVTKWGMENEMTKSHLKSTRGEKGSSVWGLLAAVRDEGDKQAAARFVEFAGAFKGQRQLFWSRGLKDRLKVDEKTDEQIAAEQQEEADLITLMTNDEWRAVYRQKKEAEFLSICEKCPDSAWDYLQYTLNEYKARGGFDSTPPKS